jgi:hypothetical protein
MKRPTTTAAPPRTISWAVAIGIAALLVVAADPELVWELVLLAAELVPEEAVLALELVGLALFVATVALVAAIFDEAEETRSE